MTRSTFRAPALLLLAALAASGCGADRRPVARVGDHTITVADFADAASRNQMQYPGPPEQAKEAILQDLVRGELMLVAAHARGTDTTATARNFERSVRDRTLMQALYAQLAPRDPGVSEAEARQMYAWRSVQADAQVIYATDETTIRHALELLDRGEPFGDVARQVNIPSMLPPGGALGFVSPGSLFPPLDAALLSQPLGKVGGPYHSPQGWFLLLVTRRMPASGLPAFELVQSQLTEAIRQRKLRETISTALFALKDSYHVTIDPWGPATMFHLLTPARVGDAPMWMPSEKDRARPMATWDGGAYTLGDAIADLQNAETQKPNASVVPALRQWIEGQVVQRLAVVEARRRHLDEEPEVARRIQSEVKNYLMEGEYNLAVAMVPPPDESVLRALWNQYQEQYPKLDRATVSYIVVPDSAKAVAIGMHGGHGGGTLAAAVTMADPSLSATTREITYPASDPEWQKMRDTFTRMNPGEWMGPERVVDGWRLLQLVSKSQTPMAFEEIPPALKQGLTNNAVEMGREARFRQYTDSLMTAIRPVPIPDALKRLPWPPAAVANAGQ